MGNGRGKKVASNGEEKQRGSNERRNYIATVFREEAKDPPTDVNVDKN